MKLALPTTPFKCRSISLTVCGYANLEFQVLGYRARLSALSIIVVVNDANGCLLLQNVVQNASNPNPNTNTKFAVLQ